MDVSKQVYFIWAKTTICYYSNNFSNVLLKNKKLSAIYKLSFVLIGLNGGK